MANRTRRADHETPWLTGFTSSISTLSRRREVDLGTIGASSAWVGWGRSPRHLRGGRGRPRDARSHDRRERCVDWMIGVRSIDSTANDRQDTEIEEVVKPTRTSLTKEMGQTVPSASHVSSGLGAREVTRDARGCTAEVNTRRISSLWTLSRRSIDILPIPGDDPANTQGRGVGRPKCRATSPKEKREAYRCRAGPPALPDP